MAALLKVFIKKENSTSPDIYTMLPVDKKDADGSIYITTSVGPDAGYDGDAGDTHTSYIIVSNTGDSTAKDITVRLSSTHDGYFYITTETTSMSRYKATIPDMEAGAVTLIAVTSAIPIVTESTTGSISLDISYATPPDNDTVDTTYNTFVDTNPHNGWNIKTHDDSDKLSAGRPYGYGVYKNPLYGQEGFIHKYQDIIAVAVISGVIHTHIYAPFTINKRYTGTELTIEDIQSFNTSDYMALDCFDGPMLPLWLDDASEDGGQG